MKILKNHSVQQYLEKTIANHLAMRSLFIRLNNQIYFSFFKKSYLDDRRMIIGKSEQLFEIEYINSYCGYVPRNQIMLTEWADKLKKISDFFAKRGQLFIYLITPSKAEYMPEKIPDRFHCQKEKVSHHVAMLTKLLVERKINFVNGTKLMEDATQEYGVDMFPRGGIHWNTLGAVVVANAIIKGINDNGMKLRPIEFNLTMSNDPQGQDRDLLWLLNLMKPNDHYPVPVLAYPNIKSNSSLRLTLIGGSFLEKLIDIFRQNKMFSNIIDYRYFKLGMLEFNKESALPEIEVNLASKTVMDPVLAANVVILEENSALTISGHGQLFYDNLFKNS